MIWLVAIEDKASGVYYTVPTESQEEVEELESLADAAGLNAVVRHADGFWTTKTWLEKQRALMP